jgi:hypothetical protein
VTVLMSVHPDGSIEILDAPEEILVADEFLEAARDEYISHGDGIMTIHASNGDVSYGLHSYDLQTMCWKGTRSSP